MSSPFLHDVLESTGYLADGKPAHGVYLGDGLTSGHQIRDFVPDALWRSESALTVYFKQAPEIPPDELVAKWRREVWNRGFAPLLWVISPEKIDLYNGFGRPLKVGDSKSHLLDTFERIDADLEKLDAFAGRLAMETGQFWEQAQSVDRRTGVDRQLLTDLRILERNLRSEKLDVHSAQGLIGRSVFTQYLIDREIVTRKRLERDYGHSNLAGILRDRHATERLFDWLRQTFNGDMFPSEDAPLPDTCHLEQVADFLDAVNPATGQLSLFPYQFDVIPVELISSIYEQFAQPTPSPRMIASENQPGQVSKGTGSETDVFYTRLSLVSLVLDETMDGLTGNETVLDLSCGSGVFLVEALRRLVALRSGAEAPTRKTIRTTLHQQICGVDISEAAVRIAAFSLYLAALELDPNPRPPHALKFKPLIGKTLIVSDAWRIDQTSCGQTVLTKRGELRKFDVIVGNPPWSYPGKKVRAERRLVNKTNEFRSPRGISLDFVNQARKFASNETRFGLVLSAVPFFSQSQTGLAVSYELIERLSPVTLVNLSHHSNWLFPRGNLPAVVLIAKRQHANQPDITAVQAPWSPSGARTQTFEIARDDVTALSLSDWQEKPELLKASFFGSQRDLALLERLTSCYEPLDHQLDRLNTKLRAGLKVGNRSRDSRFLHGLPWLTKNDIQPFSVPRDLLPYADERAERPRTHGNYRKPLLLVREFMKSEGRLVTAVSNRDLVFSDAFFGAALPAVRPATAYMLAAILSSSLASWFFLMTGSTFGLWMQRVLLRDIERMPVPDIGTSLDSKFGQRLAGFARKLRQRPSENEFWKKLDEAVFDLYGLDSPERVVAQDGLLRAKWQWKAGRIQSASAADTERHLLAYAQTFLTTMDAWLSSIGQHRMRGEVFRLPAGAPLRVVRFVIEEHSGSSPAVTEIVEPDGALRDVLQQIGERLNVPFGTCLAGRRTLRAYGPDEVVIIKPAARRHWMGVSALEDVDSVMSDSVVVSDE